jgi:hypothetical protein
MVVVAASALGAGPPAAHAWPGLPCRGPARVPAAPAGTWYRLDPQLDAGGALAGQALSVGAASGRGAATLGLARESFAAGPFDGTVLVGSDDGSASRLSLLDVPAGCGWDLGATADVVRRATLTPDRRAIVEMRVDRRTRADLGIWRRSLHGGPAVRILAPIGADARFGRTWSTEFVWQADGPGLAIQSCGEAACRTRLLSPADGAVRLVADPTLGELVGWAGDRLIVRGACRGRPCPLVSVRTVDGRPTLLDPAAGDATLLAGLDRTIRVVAEHAGRLRAMRPDGTDPVDLGAVPSGRRLLDTPSRAGAALTTPAGSIVLSPDGRVPSSGPAGLSLRRIRDRHVIPLEEVAP